MSLNSDYFILYHGLHFTSAKPVEINTNLNDEHFFEFSALILSLSRKNYTEVESLKNFQHICSSLSSMHIAHINELYSLQSSLIEYFILHKSKSNLEHLHLSFNYLLDEKIIHKEEHARLISLFDPYAFKQETITLVPHAKEEEFKLAKNSILLAISELKSLLIKHEPFDEVITYLNSQKFSVGITGVMNAGKSTLLNALLGEEILGTSMIPETANLSLIKYATKPYAKVAYWNVDEWKGIIHSATDMKLMNDFVQETQEHFKENLESYILKESREDSIEIDDLPSYTSATKSNKLCNLVKHVEIGTDLRFLHDGIEIVDTPGLDDVVVQREEITKAYMSECDLMIHLMNVSQSATSKDIEFIVDSLLYQNISKILIVITRVDMVSKKDVEEVVSYTKSSIAKQLYTANAGSKLDFIMKNIQFVALSAKMALLHKTGREKEALEAGYSLEQTGIGKVEAYLNETLYSKNSQKGMLVINSAKKRMSKAVHSFLDSLEFELSLLSKSESELKENLSKMQIKRKKDMKRIEALNTDISVYEEELYRYQKSQKSFLNKGLVKLQSVIKQRLMDETRYSLEKEKKTSTQSRYKSIIDAALKHGVLDVVRDYRYDFLKRSKKVEQALLSQYKDIFVSIEECETLFMGAFEKGFISHNDEVLVSKISQVLVKSTIKNLIDIDQELSLILKDEFYYIEELVSNRAEVLGENLLETFFIQFKNEINNYLNQLDDDENSINRSMELLSDDTSSRNNQSLELHKKIKRIRLISSGCGL